MGTFLGTRNPFLIVINFIIFFDNDHNFVGNLCDKVALITLI